MDERRESNDSETADIGEASECPSCQRTFVHLSIHKLVVHDRVPDRRCTLCGMMFESVGQLCDHLTSHGRSCLGRDTPPLRACCDCNLQFADSLALFIHMDIHPAHRIYPCGFCDRSFATRFSLLDHAEQDHSGSSVLPESDSLFADSNSCSDSNWMESESEDKKKNSSQKLTVVLGANKYFEFKKMKERKLRDSISNLDNDGGSSVNTSQNHASSVEVNENVPCDSLDNGGVDGTRSENKTLPHMWDGRENNVDVSNPQGKNRCVLESETVRNRIGKENDINHLNTPCYSPHKKESAVFNIKEEVDSKHGVDESILHNVLDLMEPTEMAVMNDWHMNIKGMLLNSPELFSKEEGIHFEDVWLDGSNFDEFSGEDDSDPLFINTDVSDCDRQSNLPRLVAQSPGQIQKKRRQISYKSINEILGMKGLQSSFRKLKRMENARPVGGPKSFRCRYCKKYLSNPKTLKFHELRHTGDYRYKCAQCNRGFPALYKLKEHSAIHDGRAATARLEKLEKQKRGELVKPSFECHHCGGRWPTKTQVKSHLEVESSCCGLEFGCQVIASLHAQREHPGKAVFRCSLCPRSYTTQTVLKRHMNISHKGRVLSKAKALFPCPTCEYISLSKHGLRKHYRLKCRQNNPSCTGPSDKQDSIGIKKCSQEWIHV